MKKLMTVLLAAALVLTAVFAFTACGDAEDAPGTANAGSTSAAEDKTPAGTAETLEDGSSSRLPFRARLHIPSPT